MHYSAGNSIGGGLAAFSMGMQQNRMRREAYREAVIAGRDRDAQIRVIKRLAAGRRRDVQAEARRIADLVMPR